MWQRGLTPRLWKPEIVLITLADPLSFFVAVLFHPDGGWCFAAFQSLYYFVLRRGPFADEKWFYIAHCDPDGDVKDVVLMKVLPSYFPNKNEKMKVLATSKNSNGSVYAGKPELFRECIIC